MKTLADVQKIAAFINRHDDDVNLGELRNAVNHESGQISGRDFMACLRVASGKALAETAILDCPAADHLLILDVALQREHVIQRKPFEVVDRNDLDNVLSKTYDQLTEEDCELIFDGIETEKLRVFAQTLDHPECTHTTVTFVNGKFHGLKSVHRGK